MQIFVEHFKKLTTNDSKSDEGDLIDNTTIDNLNVELNKPFKPDEVKRAIQKLKKIKLVAMINFFNLPVILCLMCLQNFLTWYYKRE